MNQIKDRLSDLLVDPEFEKLELWIKLPNFFSILDASRTEIRHSNFLGWILDPNDTHGMGELFLRKFLRDIFSDEKITSCSQFDVDGFDLRDVEIRREWKHIDLLIVHEDFIVVVENKIDSRDHSDQLKRDIGTQSRSTFQNSTSFTFTLLLPAPTPMIPSQVKFM